MAEDNLRSLRAGEIGRLVVGSMQSVSVNVLPEVLGQLRQERPGLAVRCVEDDDSDTLVAQLLADELDLTFLVADFDHPDIEYLSLLVDPFVLISPASTGDPLTDPGQLSGTPMIGQSPCACQQSIDNALRELGVEPDYVFLSNDNSAVQAMVRAGMGCAILPHLAVDTSDRGIVVSNLAPHIPPRQVVLARRRGRTLPPAAERFTDLAAAVCQSLQLPEFAPAMLV